MIPDDAVCVALTGGFGNQLFGFAAGLAVARRLDVPLVLDASVFSRPEEPRSYALAAVVGSDFEVLTDLPRPRRFGRQQPSASEGRLRHRFVESGFHYDGRILDVSPGTVLEGYFQAWRYSDPVREELRSRLHAAIGTLEPLNASATLHVRRGDYARAEVAAHHGMAQLAYFIRAHALLERLHGDLDLQIFTDSPDLVEETFLARWPHARIANGAADEPDVAVVGRMSQSAHFIMSNSSFSWWAAWLCAQRGDATVIAPRPWFAAGESAADLLLPGWITLDGR